MVNWCRFTLYVVWLVSFCGCQFQDNDVPLQSETKGASQRTPTKEKFQDVFINSRTIYLSWVTPYVPLRTLLLYGQDEEDMKMVELSSSERNHTLETLEPGTSYQVILQFYYNPVDKTSITKVITTVPKRIDGNEGKLKLEVQLLLKYRDPPSHVLKTLQEKVRHLLSGFRELKNIEVYPWKKSKKGSYVMIYVDGVARYHTQRIFYEFRDSLESFNSDQIGFAYRLYSECCRPLFYHSFNRQEIWRGSKGFNLKIIPNNLFKPGKCHLALNAKQSEILVQPRKQIHVVSLTFSIYVKLNQIEGLNPIVSAINYNTQMRLEVQEGKLIWMFYNLINRKGFMLSTSPVVKPREWAHVLVDYDATSGVSRVFFNGELKSKGSSHVQLGSYWMSGLKIGKYFSGGLDYKLNGDIDELHIFDCLLTFKDIKFISNACGTFECNYKNKVDRDDSIRKDGSTDTFNNDVQSRTRADTKECHPAGTKDDNSLSSALFPSSVCRCKKNVEGASCDRCKRGTFYLHQGNEDGCVNCFCNNLTNICRSANIYRKQIVLSAQDIQHLTLRTLDGTKTLSNRFLYNPLTNAVSFKSFKTVDQGNMFYWELPLRYCGDKVTSYGGNLRYTVLYLSKPYDNPIYGSDVVLIGNGKQLYYSEGEDPLPGQEYYYQVILDEKFWRHKNGAKVSREELIGALASIESFLLRAMFSTDMIETSLYEVRLDIAGYDSLASNNKILPMVEQCECPPEYFGTSCQHCNKGYTKIGNSVHLGQCERCKCNGHANDCDGKTGECRDCMHNTVGRNCEKCRSGYYGDARNGRPCKPCRCPLSLSSNQFSETCFVDRDGEQTCDACKRGYVGRNCERCGTGYYGNPNVPGQKCRKAPALSDTITPKVHVYPEKREDYLNTVASFNCTVDGPQATSIVWSRVDKRPLPNRAKVISYGNSVILLLRYLKMSDTGEYLCSAKNYFGSGEKISSLVVKGGTIEHIRVRVTPKTVIINEGRTATFTCRDDSVSDATIKWSRDDGRKLPRKAIVNHRFLTIPRVKRRHSGLYVCTGSNRYSIDKATAHLRVRSRNRRSS